jgi:hypothetical protein
MRIPYLEVISIFLCNALYTKVCLEKIIPDHAEGRGHLRVISYTPLTHTTVCSQLLYLMVETTWEVPSLPAQWYMSRLAFSVAAHESICLCRGQGTRSSSYICTSRIFLFLFPMKHLNKYWSNLLSCHGRTHTHTHTCLTNLLASYFWELYDGWEGQQTLQWCQAKESWNQRELWVRNELKTTCGKYPLRPPFSMKASEKNHILLGDLALP